MNYAILATWIAEKAEELVVMGVSRDVAERAMKGVEWESVKDMTETHRDNQLLLSFERYGSAATAERYGVKERTIRERRQAALNRRFDRHTAAA